MKTQWIFNYDRLDDEHSCWPRWFPSHNPYCVLIKNSDWDIIGHKPSDSYNILDYAIVIFKKKE